MAENNIAGFKKLMRYAQNLAEYEQGIAEGIIDENVFVIVLDEKVAKFRGQTFDWSGGGADIDLSTLATKEEVMTNEEVTAAALNDLDERVRAINDTLYGVTATKEELKSEVDKINENFTTIITDNEEVAAAAFNDLNEKIRNAVTKEELEFEVSKLDERTAYVREVSETTLSIEPNKYYKWTAAVSSLEITLTAPKDTRVLNNYMMEFTTSSTGCSLTLPTTIKWANGEVPTLDASITYQVSIINNLAVITKFL